MLAHLSALYGLFELSACIPTLANWQQAFPALGMLAPPMHAHHLQQAELFFCCLVQPQLSVLKAAMEAASMTMTSSPLELAVAA
jgi:hypothetical protein